MTTGTRQQRLEREPWSGPNRRYDILKEGAIATIIVMALTVALAAIFSSPDESALTLQSWAKSVPDQFYAVTVTELDGTSDSAAYGPPYNKNGDGQALGPIAPEKWVGVHIPVDSANDFVIKPLEAQAQLPDVTAALRTWRSAAPDKQTAWATTYDTALSDPKGANGDWTKVPDGNYGPVPQLANGLLAMATSGALDGVLAAPGQFYNTDYTKQILFLGDGSYFEDAATPYHLGGDTWGMMNEAGNFPGQQWLAPFSMWYQLPIFNSDATSGIAATLTANADIYIMSIIGVLVLIVILLPFIPGLRSIPRLIPIHRLVWRNYYRNRTPRAPRT